MLKENPVFLQLLFIEWSIRVTLITQEGSFITPVL